MVDTVVLITTPMNGCLLAKIQLPTVFKFELVILGFLYNQKREISASKLLFTSLQMCCKLGSQKHLYLCIDWIKCKSLCGDCGV